MPRHPAASRKKWFAPSEGDMARGGSSSRGGAVAGFGAPGVGARWTVSVVMALLIPSDV